jgi:hypothetical protein
MIALKMPCPVEEARSYTDLESPNLRLTRLAAKFPSHAPHRPQTNHSIAMLQYWCGMGKLSSCRLITTIAPPGDAKRQNAIGIIKA